MDYTQSNSCDTDAGTGNRMHEDSKAVPTAVSDLDMNSVIWSLMEVLKAAGIAGQQFDKANPASYTKVAKAIRTMMAGLVGDARNARMVVPAASASATFTADQLVVADSLTGAHYRRTNFNKTINLASVGLGGMDTGAAPANGFVAIYAIYNPTLDTDGVIAVNATASTAPPVYGGANLPAGYVASSLQTVVPTNGSGQFKICYVAGRQVQFQQQLVLSAAAHAPSYASMSIASAVPRNAVTVGGQFQAGNGGSAGIVGFGIGADNTGTSYQTGAGQVSTSGGLNFAGNFSCVMLVTPQVIYYNVSDTIGATYSFYISTYTV